MITISLITLIALFVMIAGFAYLIGYESHNEDIRDKMEPLLINPHHIDGYGDMLYASDVEKEIGWCFDEERAQELEDMREDEHKD